MLARADRHRGKQVALDYEIKSVRLTPSDDDSHLHIELIGYASPHVEGEEINLLVDAQGFEGELAELSIEEEQPDGGFREIAKDRALLKQGQVKVKLVPPPRQGAAGTGPPPDATSK